MRVTFVPSVAAVNSVTIFAVVAPLLSVVVPVMFPILVSGFKANTGLVFAAMALKIRLLYSRSSSFNMR
jgi:hypothetical protein